MRQFSWMMVALVTACANASIVGPAGSPDGSMDAAAIDAADVTVTCVGATTRCGGRCVDTMTDRANCGACGGTCPDTQICSAGRCTFSCPPGQSLCGGLCSDLQTDLRNCGACGSPCAAGLVCATGRCALECGPTLALCMSVGGGDAGVDAGTGAFCANTRTDRLNCGACNNQCPPGHACESGVCRVSCPPGQTVCGATCHDLLGDRRNCGACGNSCGAGEACVAGACEGASLDPIPLQCDAEGRVFIGG